MPPAVAPVIAATPAVPSRHDGLRSPDLADKYFLIQKQNTVATVRAYKTIAREFAAIQKSPIIDEIGQADVTKWQEHLALKISARTINNKIGVSEPCSTLLSSKVITSRPTRRTTARSFQKKRRSIGWAIMKMDEEKVAYSPGNLGFLRDDDPDLYWVVMLALFTGCQVGEITSLMKHQISVVDDGTHFSKIRDEKTFAGIRQVTIPTKVWEHSFKDFVADKEEKIFRYADREGKDSGNVVGQKFSRYLQGKKLARSKPVFHSVFFKEFMRDERIPFGVRCQMVGHKIENVNVTHYSDKFSVDHLAHDLSGVWLKLLTNSMQKRYQSNQLTASRAPQSHPSSMRTNPVRCGRSR